MTEPILDCAGIVACIGQGVAAAMPQHVAGTGKSKPARWPDAHSIGRGGRSASLRRRSHSRCSVCSGFTFRTLAIRSRSAWVPPNLSR